MWSCLLLEIESLDAFDKQSPEHSGNGFCMAELHLCLQEVYIMQQCSFDRNIVQFYGATTPLNDMRPSCFPHAPRLPA